MNPTCKAKHTPFQPPEGEWHCPKCGVDADGGFIIMSSVDDADPDCTLLHPEDEIECSNCGSDWSGTEIARALKKKSNAVPCPHCRGRGWMPSPTEPPRSPAQS
jgi:Zn finger protein HypA/HybF involved in hydrogenase expression